MPGPGRKPAPAPASLYRKVKRCCGEHRGPSDDQLASAHLATLAHDALHDLAHLSDEALEILWEGLFDLPTTDLSLHVKSPSVNHSATAASPQSAVADDDPDRGWEELRTVTEQIDTPQQRARLADAILRLRDQHRLTRTQAAYAIYHLNTRSQHLLAASLTHTIAVTAGANRTRQASNRRLTQIAYPGK